MSSADWSLYGDFFPIEGFGVIVLGAGKTKAGKVAAGIDPLEPASQDLLELRRDGQTLQCRYVGPGRVAGGEAQWREWWNVDFFALCLREQGTQLNFADHEPVVINVEREQFKKGARWYITFPAHDNPEPRLEWFSTLVDDASVAGFVVVPWMKSHEAKGELIRHFFAAQRAQQSS